VFIISLPLTLAILPVLLVLLGDQPFALPLSMVREILPIDHERMQEVGGKETLVVRGEILPVIALVASARLAAGAAPRVRRADADRRAQLHSRGRHVCRP
jgi:chemotaxis protein histidine kinase CheA